MELDPDALRELPEQEEQAVGGCVLSCYRSWTSCPATCGLSGT
ncbi:ALQxL family class IV lanthipeptide [Streptomyces sp. NPDC051976]